jgi:uncharacterized protein YqiB (DUF1249 family)
MSDIPDSWSVLLQCKSELEEKMRASEFMQGMLRKQLASAQEEHESVKSRINEIEYSLKLVGWKPEK